MMKMEFLTLPQMKLKIFKYVATMLLSASWLWR